MSDMADAGILRQRFSQTTIWRGVRLQK